MRRTLSDPYYTTVTSTVNVTVKPSQAGWATLSPFRAAIAPGDSITFTATGWDQAGQSYQPVGVNWRTTSGTMTGTGILTNASPGLRTVGFNLSTEQARVDVSAP